MPLAAQQQQQQEQQQSPPSTSKNNSDVMSFMSSSSSSSNITSSQTSSLTTPTANNNASHVVRNSLVAGSAAGMASTLVCHPFDVIRVKMQSTPTSNSSSSSSSVTATLRQTLQSGGGIRALYTGLTLPLLAQAVYKATVFTVNTWTKDCIVEWNTKKASSTATSTTMTSYYNYKLTMMDRFLCGCMGGAINAALFVTPVEYIRNQQIAGQLRDRLQPVRTGTTITTKPPQQQPLLLQGPLSVIKTTIQSSPKGILELWRGMTSTIIRDSVGCGCFFVAMAYTQELLLEFWKEDDSASIHNKVDHTNPSSSSSSSSSASPSMGIVIASGATAGVAFWLWALPWDTLKTWIQTGSAQNLRQAWAQHQLRTSGSPNYYYSSLFRGWQVAYGRGAPSAAITVATYAYVFDTLCDYDNAAAVDFAVDDRQ